uniref:Uncharacterized protein n=1 Tax=Setaria viridis TaxID=4556 RepID=A0A4U6SUL6_SETVI|nr:hypothetical protein SEVIR_9G159750v2 [Setaria viridis]
MRALGAGAGCSRQSRSDSVRYTLITREWDREEEIIAPPVAVGPQPPRSDKTRALVRRTSRVQPRTSPKTNPFFSFCSHPGSKREPRNPVLAFRINSSSECVNKPTIKSPSPAPLPAPGSPIRSRGSHPFVAAGLLLLAPPHFAPRRRGSEEDGAVAARRGAAGSLLGCSCRRRSRCEQHRGLPSLSPCSWYALAFLSL